MNNPKNREGFSTRATDPINNVNDEQRTVDVVFATEYPVMRYDWERDTRFMEVLGFGPGQMSTERLDAGVTPVLDNHESWSGSKGVLGKVENAEVSNNQATATLRFSKSSSVDDVWNKVSEGILSAVSVGYRVNEYKQEGTHENGLPIYRAVDWEPREVSVVGMPADPNSKKRNENSGEFPILRTIDKANKKKPEEKQPKRDVSEQINKIPKMKKGNLIDMKASRTAYSDELANLSKVEERDETQETRFAELVDAIDGLNKSIETAEKAERFLKANVQAGAAELSPEDKEIQKMGKRFSFSGAVKNLANGKAIDGVAAEWTQQARAMGLEVAGDISIPQAFLRAGGADDFQAASGDGSGFIGTEVGGFVEGLMQPLSIEAYGTKVLRGLTGNVKYPRESVNADATAEGEVDSGAASGMEMDDFTLSPNRYYNDTKISLQLLQTGDGAVDQFVSQALRRGHERRILKDIFTGSTNITGITGITGVTDIAAADGTDYAAIASALEQSVLENEGLDPNCMFVLSPSAYNYFKNAPRVANVEALIHQGLLQGYKFDKTPYFADASSGVGQILFGNFELSTLAYFGALNITVDPFSAKKTGQIEISMTQFADFNLDQPGGFAIENGVATS